MPSWIPRWDLPLESGSRLYLPHWEALTDRHSAIHEISMAESSGSSPQTKLRVRVVILDSVVYVSDVLRPPHMDDIAKLWKTIVQFSIPNPYPAFCCLHAFVQSLPGSILEEGMLSFREAEAAYLLDIHRRSGEVDAIEAQSWRTRAKDGDTSSYESFVEMSLCGKRIFLTQRGYIGTAYTVSQTDQCGIIFGCKMPSILRSAKAENTYTLLGSAYMQGAIPQTGSDDIQGFTMLGTKESKDWTTWDVEEDDILLC